jgi:hypothetical protein
VAITSPEIRIAPLGPQTQPRMARHDIICVHTMVGYLVSTDRFFRVSNGAGYAGTESHFGVGGKWGPDLGGGWDGAIWRWQDLAHTADANVDGNPRVISIETADNAARPIAPWTDAQVDSLVHLIAWLCTPAAHADCPPSWPCHQVGIPPMLVPDTQPTRRGLAYHAQGAADRTVGEWWSTDHHKDCPTPARVEQYKRIVIPRVAARLNGEEDDDVSYDDVVRALRDVLRLPGNGLAVPHGQVDNGNLAAILVGMSQEQVNRDNANAAQERASAAAVQRRLDGLPDLVISKLEASSKPTPDGGITLSREAIREAAKEGVRELLQEGIGAYAAPPPPAGG